MTKFPFTLDSDDSLIRVNCEVDEDKCFLALDTGASHTVVDLSFLMVSGYSPNRDSIGRIYLETAIGPTEAFVVKLKKFSALGIAIEDFEVASYDFLTSNVLTDIDGVLGLDFFKNKDLLISFKNFEITVS